MASRTLSQLRDDVRELSHNETLAPSTAFVTDTELNQRINEACGLFHNLMAELQRHEWVLTSVATQSIALAAGTNTYTLAPQFFILKGYPRMSDGDRQYRVRPWDWSERDLMEEVDQLPWIEGYTYRIYGTTIHILPDVRSSYTLHVDFVPEFSPLANDGDTITVPYGWWKWITLLAAIDLYLKEDLDASHLERQHARWDQQIRAMAAKRGHKRLRMVDARRDAVVWPRRGRMAEG